jgi:2-polyprenyl-3-methyl-5-hydroxy-6-metoxy-1,4-benzoquinol methylase
MPEESICTEGGLSQVADISASHHNPASGITDLTVCPACSASDIADLFHAKDYLVSGSEFLVMKCNHCGMGWTVNPPPESRAGDYYASEEYISHTDRKESFSDYLYHIARSFMLGRKKRLVTKATGLRTGALLDIGSGTGYFASFMQKKGWKVTGIEIDDKAREYSVAMSGIDVVTPDEITNLPSGSADCITFWHVLEHLYEPGRWLKEVKRILTANGKCIIALPNFSSADANWFRSMWAALDVPRHLWHFTPQALNLYLSKQGFVIEKIAALPLDVFYISALSYKNQGKPLPLIRGLITGSFLSVRSGFRNEKASSLVFVLSKKN